MIINNQEVNIDDLYSQHHMHKEVKKGIFLSDFQLEILEKYSININDVSSINELIYLINEILDEETDADDLEILSNELAEFNYYSNTNK